MNTPSGGSPESNSPDDGKDGGKKLEQQKSTDSGSPTQVGVCRLGGLVGKVIVSLHKTLPDATSLCDVMIP